MVWSVQVGGMGLMVWSVQGGDGVECAGRGDETDGLPCFTDTERCD